MLRSALVTVLFFVLLSQVFTRPWLGPVTFLWVSVMNPHRLTYGFATGVPFALIAAITSLVVLMFTKQRRAIPRSAVTITYVLFFVWMSTTALLAITVPEDVWRQWQTVSKIHVMIFITIALVFTKTSIDALVWVLVGSVAYFGIKGGIFTVLTGGQYLVWGPPSSVIEGNNELGLALVMIIPLMFYLYTQVKRASIRFTLVVSAILCMISVLGTHSRGALLALLAMALVLGAWSKRPVANTLVIGLLVMTGALLMPDSWTGRMETIRDYQGDASAMSRINSWKMIWALAMDRPIFGGGFRIDNVDLYLRYLPGGDASGYAPHSIYFQALGEHGFVGLFLYVALLVATWIKCQRMRKGIEAEHELAWAAALAKMIQIAMVGFMAGGAFLGLLHWDVPYYFIGLTVILSRIFEMVDRPTTKAKAPAYYGLRWSR